MFSPCKGLGELRGGGEGVGRGFGFYIAFFFPNRKKEIKKGYVNYSEDSLTVHTWHLLACK